MSDQDLAAAIHPLYLTDLQTYIDYILDSSHYLQLLSHYFEHSNVLLSPNDPVFPLPAPTQALSWPNHNQQGGPYSCVPPTFLYSPSSITPANTPSNSRIASPDAVQGQMQVLFHPLLAQPSTSASASSPTSPSTTSAPCANTTLSQLLSKPFCCPKPNCNKSYKQANGLKYHMTHGSCNFTPPKDLEALQALLCEKGVVINGNDCSEVQITEGVLLEVEREAERRLRPFACDIGNCQQ